MRNILFDKIIDGEIVNISRVCNLISIQINSSNKQSISLHIQSFFRILDENNIVIASSEDVYRPATADSAEHFSWDVPGQSIFDKSINDCKLELLMGKIKHVQENDIGDLVICIDNGYKLQILIDTTVAEEKYRLFDVNEEFVFINRN